MTGAHPRDGMTASGTMSSPSRGWAVELPPHCLWPAAAPGTVCPRAVEHPTRYRQPSCRARHVVVCCPP
jgi:hypothetical protein